MSASRHSLTAWAILAALLASQLVGGWCLTGDCSAMRMMDSAEMESHEGMTHEPVEEAHGSCHGSTPRLESGCCCDAEMTAKDLDPILPSTRGGDLAIFTVSIGAPSTPATVKPPRFPAIEPPPPDPDRFSRLSVLLI